ncbi:MAG: nucleotidyltransferase family protein [Pseudohongiella sp.]|jgi:molybdenum cofactor cytidylyltransferase|nr:nucleotidyltransferase family protein [Pseudohongiella sp.]
MPDTIGAIILAAGFSHRFGSSKLLAKLDNGNTVFQQTLQNVSAAIPSVLIVSRPEIAPALAKYSTGILLFEQAEHGMGATLSFAAQQIEGWTGCLVCLADMPFITVDTYAKIAARLTGEKILIPTYQSQAGNPVAFGKKYFNQLRQLQGDSGGKSIIASRPESVLRMAVDDPGILQDVDTENDLTRYQSKS